MPHFDVPLNLRRALIIHEGPAAVVTEIQGRPAIVIKAPAADSWPQDQVNIRVTSEQKLFHDNMYVQCNLEFTDDIRNVLLFAWSTYIDAVQQSNLARLWNDATCYEFLIFDALMNSVFSQYGHAVCNCNRQKEGGQLNWKRM